MFVPLADTTFGFETYRLPLSLEYGKRGNIGASLLKCVNGRNSVIIIANSGDFVVEHWARLLYQFKEFDLKVLSQALSPSQTTRHGTRLVLLGAVGWGRGLDMQPKSLWMRLLNRALMPIFTYKETTMNKPLVSEARSWAKILAPYKLPHHGRSVFELILTMGLFALCWGGMLWSVGSGYWLYFLLLVPTAGLLVRMFLIQHDCGHGSFFRSKLANDWLGRFIGVLTLTPYDFWKRTHAIHHASSGNLDRRGLGDVDTITVHEYRALSPFRQLLYRLYRNPLVMFVLGPTYLFFLQHRLPIGLMRRGWVPWVSAMSTNVGIIAVAIAGMWIFGVKEFLIIQIPVTILATTIGVWLFFVQHQFEGAHWDHEEDWSRHHAALHGSSHYDLPPVLTWFTANIGIHHVHHLASGIPFYRLGKVLIDHPELKDVGRITIGESLRCIPLALWDEDSRKLISFREFRQMTANQASA